MRILPDFSSEQNYWNKGYVVIGVDEVGRGAVAGPVVAGAVAFQNQKSKIKDQNDNAKLKNKELLERLEIDDSKRLTRKQREELIPYIKKYFYWGIGEVDVGTINNIGISKATRLAMTRAIKSTLAKISNSKLQIPNKYTNSQKFKFKILIDGYKVKYLPGGLKHQNAIIKGDQKSISIAAASIIAKVYRDNLMKELDNKYIHYEFNRHVGYGTKLHRMMIEKYGMCKIHRKQFVYTLMNTLT